jgi:hypothetical protein
VPRAGVAVSKSGEANRANALKSTGPTSREGKAAIGRNHLIHGLTSRTALLPDEDEEEFTDIRDSLREYHRPEGWPEEELVDRMATTCLRRRRAARMEAELLEHHRYDGERDQGLGLALMRDAHKGCVFDKIIRYEATLDRNYYRAVHELQRLQAARRGEHVPVPLAVDVTIDRRDDGGHP